MNLSSLQILLDETEFLLCHSLGGWRSNIEKARKENRETPQHLLAPFGELSKAALTIQRLIKGRVEINRAINHDALNPRPQPKTSMTRDIAPAAQTDDLLPRAIPMHKDPTIAAISKRMRDLIKSYKEDSAGKSSLPSDETDDPYDLDEDEDETKDEEDEEDEEDADGSVSNENDDSKEDDNPNPDGDGSNEGDDFENDEDDIEVDDVENSEDDESDIETDFNGKNNRNDNNNRNGNSKEADIDDGADSEDEADPNAQSDQNDEADSEDEDDPRDFNHDDEDDLSDSDEEDEDQADFLENPNIDNDSMMTSSMRLIHDLANPKKEIYKLCSKMIKAVRDYPAPP